MKDKPSTILPSLNKSKEDSKISAPLTSTTFQDTLKRMKNLPTQNNKLLTDINIYDNEDQSLEKLKILDKMYQKDHLGIYVKMKENLMTEPNYTESSKEFNNKFGFSFGKTNYCHQSAFGDFYSKFHKYKIISRKQPFEKETPSLAFIKSTNKEMIMPNPLGLLKRKGDINKIDMKNQKVGDSYIKALSSSLKFCDHIKEINLQSNRIGQLGASHLFESFNLNKLLRYNLRILNLADNNLGDKGIEIMILYLQDRDSNLEELNVEGNLLGDKNIQSLSDALAKYAQYRMTIIKMGKNNISNDSAPSIANMINACNGLREFSINWNKLTNPGATLIINKLRPHTELRILDFAWNCIGNDLTKDALFEEIVEYDRPHPARNFHNFELNQFTKTMRIVFKRSPLLPAIDANPKGKAQPEKKKEKDKPKDKQPTLRLQGLKPKSIVPPLDPSPFAKELGLYFKEPSIGLIHLDISHNNLPFHDAAHLASECKDNHTILGMHLDGNEISIDSLGFLHSTRKEEKYEGYFPHSQIHYSLESDSSITKTSIEAVRKIRSRNKCWICEGWRETEFEFIPSKPIKDPNSHMVKIHLSFEDWKPYDMLLLGTKYQIRRMCPPGDIQYFFTVDAVPEGFGSYGTDGISLTKVNQINFEFDDEYMEEYENIQLKLRYDALANTNTNMNENSGNNDQNNQTTNGQEQSTQPTLANISLENNPDLANIRKITIQCIGHHNVKHNPGVITDDYRKTFKYCEPRPVKIFNRFVKPRTPWTYPVSIWAYYDYPYDGDSEEYLDKCFEFDFNRCQLFKDVKEEDKLKELKTLMREKYRDIIDCYKYYSSYSGFTIWAITQNNLTDFISKCVGLCDKTYDVNNVYLKVKELCGSIIDKDERVKNNNKNLGDNLVRHQFFGLFVKAAKDKYVRTFKTFTDVLEAVKFSFENHYDQAITGYEYHQWRKERYYNEQVDNFLKAYLPLLDGVYKSWAKQKGPRKQDVWMVLDEYNSLVTSFVNIDEYPIRDNPLFFNQSIKLQVNEIFTDKHVNMFFPEFLEALCRAIDKASPFPPDEAEEDWPKEKRLAQPLINKLENIIGDLIKLITHPDYKTLKEKCPMPVKDLATGLYIINNESPFYQGFIIGQPKIKIES